MAESAFARLIEHARSEHVVVVGGGIAGMVAARELAKVGVQVTLVEQSARLGGQLGAVEVGGVEVGLGATAWSGGADGDVSLLARELGLGDDLISPADEAEWLAIEAGVVPVPRGSVAGIPANPWDEDVRRVIGWGGTWRAYLDRLRPPLTIGQQRNLGALVATRMGRKVRDRLVAPVTRGRYGLAPDDADVQVVARGLGSALTRTGSLSGAVGERAETARDGSLQGVRGGLPRLMRALEASLNDYAVTVLTNTRVSAVRAGDGWTVDAITPEGAHTLTAHAVVVACREVSGSLDVELPPVLARELVQDIVTLVVDAPAPATRRASVYIGEGAELSPVAPVLAADETARWGEGGRSRVLRLTYGDLEHPSPLADFDAEALTRAATEHARVLLDVSGEVRGIHCARVVQTAPAALAGRLEAGAAVRQHAARLPALAVVGEWVTGPGLGRVVSQARSESERLRVSLLWGEHPDGATLGEDHPIDQREETP
ncbi:hypothetical protein GCM10009808_18840 [Microbacterium sediminicola]|uniref:Amine oxidase domain-containing protein n=1 Tax=Microbacterium sediminicola TaxID=415210 RepID=A0ABP4UEU3_9MICO